MKTTEILDLLQSKNRCLDRLMEATRSFLAAPIETLIILDEQASDKTRTPLMVYEEERLAIIRTLELHDKQVNTLIGHLTTEEKSFAFMESVRAELLENERLIQTVINADDMVFGRIREAQGQITKLLQENRKSGEILSKFKSGSKPTGEGMDKTL